MTAQTILPANTLSSESYDVANSLMFDDGSSPYLTKTVSSGDDMTAFTFSFWVKRSTLGATQRIISSDQTDSKDMYIRFESNDQFGMYHRRTDSENVISGFQTAAVFRDTSAWYHFVINMDSTDSTEANRIKMYVNGTRVTTFAGTVHYPTSGEYANFFNTNEKTDIGYYRTGTNEYFDGYLAEVVAIQGTAYQASDFGEFDSASGIWKPKDVSGLTFGTNGFYHEFKQAGTSQNSSGLGADTSGNDNHFAVSGLAATDQSTDTCTNNFARLNPLNVPTSNRPTFAEGNLKVTSGTTGQAYMGSSTIGVSSGKWYAEMKVLVIDSMIAGVSANVAEDARDSSYPGAQDDSAGILFSSGNKYIDDNGTTHGDAFTANDILMIALDLDNNRVYFGRNGNWFDGSGNADESNPNSALALTAAASTLDGFYFFSVGDGGGSAAAAAHWNFGSPSYAISSGNADGEGFGNFEYAVPSGYLALCTKNLAENG